MGLIETCTLFKKAGPFSLIWEFCSRSIKHQNFFFFCHGTWHIGCGILVPEPGIKPVPPAVEAQNPDYQTTREVSASDLEGHKRTLIFETFQTRFETFINKLLMRRCRERGLLV